MLSAFAIAVASLLPAADDSVAWVFESETYAKMVRSKLTTAWEVLHCDDEACALAGAVDRVRAVIGRADATNLSALPNLDLVQSASYFHTDGARVPLRAAIAATKWWSHEPMHGNEQIAEWVIASIFDDVYALGRRAAAFRQCAFASDAAASCDDASSATNHTLVSDLTIGVLGYGHIGIQVAKRAAALGATVIATKRHGPFVPTPPGLKWLSDDNDRLYREADVVVSCVPGVGDEAPKMLINATSLALMKPGAMFVTVSAGPVDFAALIAALRDRPSFRAVVDLWPAGCWHYPNVTCGAPLGQSNWPYPTDALAHLPNALPLPGMAMRDARFWSASAENAAANLDRLKQGRPLLGVVRNASIREPGHP